MFFSFARTYTGSVIQIASTLALVRLLSPEEFGVYSVAAGAVGIVSVLRDFGVARYIVQEKELTPERQRTAFGIMILSAWSIGLLLFLLKGPFAAFYGNEQLAEIFAILAINFIVVPFGTPTIAILQRRLQFGTIFVIGTIGAIVGAGTSVGMAVAGYGVVSLAWGPVANTVVVALCAVGVQVKTSLIAPSLREWRRVAGFSVTSTAEGVVMQLSIAAPDLIIGQTLGFEAVGLFNRAQNAVNLFRTMVIQSIHGVAFPAFAEQVRSGEAVKPGYLKGVSYIASVSFPFFGFVFLFSYEIIAVLFGQQWTDSVPSLQILALFGAISSMASLNGMLILGLGEIRLLLYLTLVTTVMRVALVLPAAFYSIELVAAAHVVWGILTLIVHKIALQRLVDLRWIELAEAARPGILITLAVNLPMAMVMVLLDQVDLEAWVALVIASLLAGFVWLLAIYAFRHPLWSEVERLLKFAQRRS